MGSLEFDDENAVIEDAKLREQVESYNRRLREFEEQSKARSRHLAGLVTSTGHTQFPSHHHLQSDLLLEVSFVICKYCDGTELSAVKPQDCSWNSSSWFFVSYHLVWSGCCGHCLQITVLLVLAKFRYFCTTSARYQLQNLSL